jgi:aspartate/methionine/tyrosine aminotransferase
VALLAGSAFGAHGRGYLRLSTAAPRETIEGALDAMRGLLEQG